MSTARRVSRALHREGLQGLTGALQPAGPEQPQKVKLSAEDRELVRSQGAVMNANRVTEAK